MENNCHYSIVVRGRVQGVGYRAFALKIANQFKITGFVKNMADGSVQIEAEGKKSFLDQYVKMCEKGPGWAYVERVDFSESPMQGLHEFYVKH